MKLVLRRSRVFASLRYNAGVGDTTKERDRVAGRIVDGDAAPAIAICRADPAFAEKVSNAAASLLIARASARWNSSVASTPVWPGAQRSFPTFATVAGADAQRLAEALLECCLLESVSGEPDQLEDEALRFILDHCTPQIEDLLEQPFDPPIPDELVPPWKWFQDFQSRFIIDAMWTLPGEEGVEWMQRVLKRDPYSVVSRRPLTWTAEDWILRLNSISDMDEFPWEAYAVTGVVLDQRHPPPIEAAPALVRYSCARLRDDSGLKLVRRAAAIIGGYRTGDPHVDMRLFWWQATTDAQREILRWMIELSGPAGSRKPLVAAALADGRIDAQAAAILDAPVDRPLWADGDVPWVFTDVTELGVLALSAGVLQVGPCSPAGAFRRAWQLEVEPGDHAVRAIVAVHPFEGCANAAVEVVFDANTTPDQWERISQVSDDARIGLLGAAPVAAPTAAEVAELPTAAGWAMRPERSAVWFAMPAAGRRTLWLGRSAGPRVLRVVLDLGRMNLDLADAAPPWLVHDRVPLPADVAPATLVARARVGAAKLRELAHRGASLRDQRMAVRNALHQRGVSEYSSAVVMRHVRDGIALTKAGSPRRSRLGGAGRLPPGASWPALESGDWHLGFLAELALSELPHVEPLPPDGTLLIYQDDTWSCERDPLSATRVIYVPEGVSLTTPTVPEQLLFNVKPKPLAGMAVPIAGESELVVEALELAPDHQRVIDTMNELMHDWPGDHWLLGASVDIQGPARLGIPYALKDLPEHQRARFAQPELDGDGWVLLAQINEDDTADIGIGDGGCFYLFIPEVDLQQLRFDRVVGIMQCH